jgi:hypothetical protein
MDLCLSPSPRIRNWGKIPQEFPHIEGNCLYSVCFNKSCEGSCISIYI